MKVLNKIDFTALKKYDLILASILVILAVVILSAIYLYPNFAKAQEIYSQEKSLRSKLTTLRKKLDLLTSLDQNLYEKNIGKLNRIMPVSKDYVSLFDTLDSLQNQSGVTVTSTVLQLGDISTASAKLKKTTTSMAYDVPITIEVIGSLEKLQNFIKDLKNLSGRIITLKEITWGRSVNETLQVSLKGYAYFYPIAGTIGSIDTPLNEVDREKGDLLDKVNEVSLEGEALADDFPVESGKVNLFE